jgi:hypothetical protein
MNIEQLEAHYHGNHELVKNALMAVSTETKVSYERTKSLFINQDARVSFLFWKHFYAVNPFRTYGVEYCASCKKFSLIFVEPREFWSLENDLA